MSLFRVGHLDIYISVGLTDFSCSTFCLLLPGRGTIWWNNR